MIDAPSLVTFSIVSHGQGRLIRSLLSDLRAFQGMPFEILLTLNIPEDEAYIAEFLDLPLSVLRNPHPKGFGANHNAAFRSATAPYFMVVNPDVRLQKVNLQPLLDVLADPTVGVVAPMVLSAQGQKEDNARHFPTFRRLASRFLFKKSSVEYANSTQPQAVEWVAGIFMVFPRSIYVRIGGFDERYFMYLEDADICRRLAQAGLRSVVVSSVSVIHDAQRASRRNLRHFGWHLRSVFRFLYGI